jgi:hypothetical protein
MTVGTFTPAIGTLATTEADLTGTTVATNEEWKFDIRLTNTTSSAVTVRIAVSDGAGTPVIKYLTYDYSLSGNTSIDVCQQLTLPAGYRIRGRAGTTTAVDYVITGRKRSTL